MYQLFRMKSLTAISARVGPGSRSSLPSKSLVKRGSTQVSMKMVVPTASVPMMQG